MRIIIVNVSQGNAKYFKMFFKCKCPIVVLCNSYYIICV